MENKELYDVIISDKLTWEGLIRDIVRDERMDPWNINIIQLAKRFAQHINKKKDILRISGKFILTASILLKMKSDFLLTDEEETSEEGVSLGWLFKKIDYELGARELIPRIPMMKKRRVTLEELIGALRKAIEVKDRRIVRLQEREESRVIPLKLNRVNLTEKINDVYSALTNFFKKRRKSEVMFEELLPSHERFDVIWTFMPLMHLSSRGKVDLFQEKTFGDIIVRKS